MKHINKVFSIAIMLTALLAAPAISHADVEYEVSEIHNYVDYEAGVRTGLSNGNVPNICVNCGEEAIIIDYKPATCKEPAYCHATCNFCGEENEGYCGRPLGHRDIVIYDSYFVAPSCTTAGSNTDWYKCNDCDTQLGYEMARYKSLGHDIYLAEESIGVCGYYDYWIYKCSRCNYFYMEEGPATEHDYVNGTCTKCGDHQHTITEYVAKNLVLPTCEKDGSITLERTCIYCDEIIELRNIVIEATGHDFEFTHSKNPTCFERGYEVYRCKTCGVEEIRNEQEVLSHVESDEQIHVTWMVPTCAANGLEYYYTVCELCGSVMSETEMTEIPATGHHYANGVCEWCEESEEPDEPVIEEPEDPTPEEPEKPEHVHNFNKKGKCKTCGYQQDSEPTQPSEPSTPSNPGKGNGKGNKKNK